MFLRNAAKSLLVLGLALLDGLAWYTSMEVLFWHTLAAGLFCVGLTSVMTGILLWLLSPDELNPLEERWQYPEREPPMPAAAAGRRGLGRWYEAR